MADKLRILSDIAQIARDFRLLECQSDGEASVACCTRRFLPLARRIAGDDDVAKDILQESCVRVPQHVCQYRGGSPACGWVRAVIRDCALDLSRQSKPPAKELDANLRGPRMDPEALASERELLQLFRASIDSVRLASGRTVSH